MATDNDCPICQESLHGAFAVGCTVPCGHVFHRKCFETWQTHSAAKRCPCCNVELTTFIDKIHISLPITNTSSLSATSISTAPATTTTTFMQQPSPQLQRRQALSYEKAKRSAVMRHRDRRAGSSSTELTAQFGTTKKFDLLLEYGAPTKKKDPLREERLDKSTSLSALLQRIPYMRDDPVKFKKVVAPFYNYPEDFRNDIVMPSCSDFSSVQHLEEEIPNVANNIMRNIELSLHPKRRTTRGFDDKKVASNTPKKAMPILPSWQ